MIDRGFQIYRTGEIIFKILYAIRYLKIAMNPSDPDDGTVMSGKKLA